MSGLEGRPGDGPLLLTLRDEAGDETFALPLARPPPLVGRFARVVLVEPLPGARPVPILVELLGRG